MRNEILSPAGVGRSWRGIAAERLAGGCRIARNPRLAWHWPKMGHPTGGEIFFIQGLGGHATSHYMGGATAVHSQPEPLAAVVRGFRIGVRKMARKGSIISSEVFGFDPNVTSFEQVDKMELAFNVEGAGKFTLPLGNLSNAILIQAALHGLRQKIADAAAMPKDDENNTPEGKLAAMQAVADGLSNGEWSKRSGDGSGPVAGVIYRAFERWVGEQAAAKKAKAPDAETIRAVYDKKTRAEQLALKKVSRIAEIIEELKAERGAKGIEVSTDDLLGELGI